MITILCGILMQGRPVSLLMHPFWGLGKKSARKSPRLCVELNTKRRKRPTLQCSKLSIVSNTACVNAM